MGQVGHWPQPEQAAKAQKWVTTEAGTDGKMINNLENAAGQQHLKFSENQVKIVLKSHIFGAFLELRIFAFSVIYYHTDSLKNYFRCIVRNNQVFTLF